MIRIKYSLGMFILNIFYNHNHFFIILNQYPTDVSACCLLSSGATIVVELLFSCDWLVQILVKGAPGGETKYTIFTLRIEWWLKFRIKMKHVGAK